MKLTNKLLTIVSIGIVASTITPLTVSCQIDNGMWKDITKPNTNGWKQTEIPYDEIQASEALNDYFGAIAKYGDVIVENDVKWSGWESHEMLPILLNRKLSDRLIIENCTISKWQGYFKDFSYVQDNRTASFKTGLNAILSADALYLLNKHITVKLSINLAMTIENELYKVPMNISSVFVPSDPTNFGSQDIQQHQLVSLDYNKLLNELQTFVDSYAKMKISLKGNLNYEKAFLFDIDWKSDEIIIDQFTDPESEMLELYTAYTVGIVADGWFTYYFKNKTIIQEQV